MIALNVQPGDHILVTVDDVEMPPEEVEAAAVTLRERFPGTEFTLVLGAEAAPLNRERSFDEWVQYGVDRGWVAAPVCDTHDGVPMTPAEVDQWDDDDEDPPCIPVIRVWQDGAPEAVA